MAKRRDVKNGLKRSMGSRKVRLGVVKEGVKKQRWEGSVLV